VLKLYDWQEEDANWLFNQNSLLAHACGLGKTVVAVEGAKRFAQGPILVIAPRSVKPFWEQVIQEQDAGYVGVCGRAGRGIPWARIKNYGFKRPLAWVVVHPEAVRISVHELGRIYWGTIIVDEAHRFSNRNAQQTKALKRLRARRKLMLTATPYGKSPADMWALLNFLYPEEFTSYWAFFDKYVESYRAPQQRFSVVMGPKNLPRLARLVGPYYKRRKKSEVLNLPPLVYTDAPVVINGAQEQLYLKLRRDMYAELIGQEIVLPNALAMMVRLQQCALDPNLMLGEETEVLALGKIPAKVEWLAEWLEDHPNESVVIVSRFRKFVEKWLRGLAPEATIVGGMSLSQTQAALATFERTGRLVGSLDSVKEGLNLQRASTMIVMDGMWSSTAEYQLSQRIHRVGTVRSCNVIHLVGRLETSRKSTVDELLRNAVTKKWKDAEMVNEFIKNLQEEM